MCIASLRREDVERTIMTLTHDVVIIGATYEGIAAAKRAINLKKLVALVQQPFTGHLGTSESVLIATSSQITYFYRILNQWEETAIYPRWERVRSWAIEVDATIKARDSLAILAARGVDVIEGSGEFVRLPRLGFIAGDRKLFAASYLIATGTRPRVPAILGLEEIPYLQPSDIWKIENIEIIPRYITIIGDTPIALCLAQLLRRFGKEITLIISTDRLLPSEDPEISRWVGALLEAEGVRILTGQSVSQVKAIDGQKLLQLGNHVMETEEILLAGDYESNHEGLNLEGVGVTVENGRIQTNQRLQTTNPRIYACHGLENDYPDPAIALENALLLSKSSLDRRTIPRILPLDPAIARVGLTETQARQQYGERIQILPVPWKQSITLTMTGETTGFGKIIVTENEKILGACLIGSGGKEAIGSIALAMRENLPISSLNSSIYPFASLSEIIGLIGDSFPHPVSWIERLKRFFRGK
jgi:mercuric reductase